MDARYTEERNTQILISLMKAHGIKKIVVSPGATNVSLVGSLQYDSYFELYSSVDERSAAYIACGLAAESGEIVALSCTGATASRNYIPGLTEAFYRKLPILAITSTQPMGRVGHHVPQVIDRSNPLNDIVKYSLQLATVSSKEDEWSCIANTNKALLELTHHGGGPVHINLETTYNNEFTAKELPVVRKISRVCYGDELPQLSGKVAIYVGSHKKWTKGDIQIVEEFCESYNAVVLCDHTSNYKGKYRVLASLLCSQKDYTAGCRNVDILIHIGEVSGAEMEVSVKAVWRVSVDGEVRDTFRKLVNVFEMEEMAFFKSYISLKSSQEGKKIDYFEDWKKESDALRDAIPDIPFSNVWIAKNTAHRLPGESCLHLGILNSLRSWNYFEIPESVHEYSNVGGFGIDGNVSTLMGAALANPNKLFFGVVGDLAFFYDMNILGNRYFSRNVRLLIVNNGRGTEFRNYNHRAATFAEDADWFMAAAGHYGNKSKELIKHYATDLSFEYMTASNKEEYLVNVDRFLDAEITEKPMILEVFTESEDESEAIKIVQHLKANGKGRVRQIGKEVLGENGYRTVKKIVEGFTK